MEGDITPRAAAPSIGLTEAMAAMPDVFRVPRATKGAAIPDPVRSRGQRIRESARGQDCQIRYIGVCTHDPAATIWSHARWGAQLGEFGKGMGTKSTDLLGAYACTNCDAAYDQMIGIHPGVYTRDSLDLDWLMGHLRSLGILQRDGIV